MPDLFDVQTDLHRSDAQREGRYWGFLSGKITNVNDSQGLVRVKARIGGQFDNEESDWLIPAFPGSLEGLPSNGDPCIVGFIDGDPHRGFWLYHPESTTRQRPNHPLGHGDVVVGLLNNIIDQLQTLQTSFNAHTHTYVYGTTGTPSALWNPTLGKGQASDGSIVASITNATRALSALLKIR